MKRAVPATAITVLLISLFWISGYFISRLDWPDAPILLLALTVLGLAGAAFGWWLLVYAALSTKGMPYYVPHDSPYTHLCRFHPDNPARDMYERIGITTTCLKSNLASWDAVISHMENRHKEEWATVRNAYPHWGGIK